MKEIKPPYFHIIILVALMAVAGYLFYVNNGLQENAVKLRNEVGSISSNEESLKSLSVTLPALSPEVENWSKSLPLSEVEVAQFASFLDQAAGTQNLQIVIHLGDFPTISDVSGKKMTTLPLDIALDGSYQGITKFIEQVSNSEYFYKIDKLSLTKQQVKPGVRASLVGWLIMNTKN